MVSVMVFVLGFLYRLRDRPARARRRREGARSYECVRLAEEFVDLLEADELTGFVEEGVLRFHVKLVRGQSPQGGGSGRCRRAVGLQRRFVDEPLSGRRVADDVGDGHGAIDPNDFHVPGVPAVVQTHPMDPPGAGAVANTMSPTLHVPDVGAAEE